MQPGKQAEYRDQQAPLKDTQDIIDNSTLVLKSLSCINIRKLLLIINLLLLLSKHIYWQFKVNKVKIQFKVNKVKIQFKVNKVNTQFKVNKVKTKFPDV